MLFRNRLKQGSDRSLNLIRASLSAIALSTLLLVGSNGQPVGANTHQMRVELPLRADADAQKSMHQAELMVSEILNQQFSEDRTLSTLEVVILGNRDGEIVPMLTTVTSRDQWTANPQVEAWTTYSSSFAYLFYQPRPAQVVAVLAPQSQPQQSAQASQRTKPSRSNRATRRPTSQLPERSVIQIERAYDEGRLNQRQLNDFVDLLD